jgi:hypothetical protein
MIVHLFFYNHLRSLSLLFFRRYRRFSVSRLLSVIAELCVVSTINHALNSFFRQINVAVGHLFSVYDHVGGTADRDRRQPIVQRFCRICGKQDQAFQLFSVLRRIVGSHGSTEGMTSDIPGVIIVSRNKVVCFVNTENCETKRHPDKENVHSLPGNKTHQRCVCRLFDLGALIEYQCVALEGPSNNQP